MEKNKENNKEKNNGKSRETDAKAGTEIKARKINVGNTRTRKTGAKIYGETKQTALRGSFTVEAALLMTILLPVLVSVIYFSFYLHDRAVLQGISCEIGAMGSNLRQEKKAEAILKEKQRELSKDRLLGTRNIEKTLSVSEKRVSVTFSGSYPFPGLIMKLIGGSRMSIQRSWSREVYYPAKLIRKIRGLNDMVDTLKE